MISTARRVGQSARKTCPGVPAGLSPRPVRLPHARLGVEGTGVIDALGSGVTGLAIGDPAVLAADARAC
jgi:Zn-dependent alcohol dehydrogenase